MTEDLPPSTPQSSSTAPCRACGSNVPEESFCGRCGAALTGRRGWLRLGAHAAANEHVLRPSLVTTAFPRLPARSRPVFRVAVVVLIALLAGLVALRWQPPLIGISALGLPLLFAGYLRASDAFDDLSRTTLGITAALSIGVGVGWTIATDAIWARTYDDVLGTPMTSAEKLTNLVVVPIGGALLMLAPIVVVRVWRPGVRESLDGFAIGATSVLSFTAAGILTRAAPEFANGLVDPDFPVAALAALAAIRGVAAPLTAVAVGGLVGASLWVRRRTDPEVVRHWYSPASPAPAIGVALLATLGQNAVDFAWISYGQIVGLYGAITVLALLALRIGQQAKLLGEPSDDTALTRSVRCPECGVEGPDQAFCANCGVATNASSRTARRALRSATDPVSRTSLSRQSTALGGALAVVVVTTIGLSQWLTPAPANYACPPDCGRPPLGQPVTTNPRFAPSTGEFSVSYPGPGTAYEATLESNGVLLELHAGDGGSLQLFGEPAAGRTPRQVVEDLVASTVPDAKTDYEIPNAMVGYQLGYGVVTDVFKAGSAGDSQRLRVLVMAAVKNDYALVAAAAGPYREFTPDFGTGHPSGANFFLALDMSKYVNSFSWRGDPPR